MNKAIMATILAGDVLLVIFGIILCNFAGFDTPRFAIDSSTDKILWMLSVVVVAPILAVMTLRRDVAHRLSLNLTGPSHPPRTLAHGSYSAADLRRPTTATPRLRKPTPTYNARGSGGSVGKKKRHAEVYFDRHTVSNLIPSIDPFSAHRAHR